MGRPIKIEWLNERKLWGPGWAYRKSIWYLSSETSYNLEKYDERSHLFQSYNILEATHSYRNQVLDTVDIRCQYYDSKMEVRKKIGGLNRR